jgi:hypothetical protein
MPSILSIVVVGTILGVIFGILAAIALVIVGYVFVLPRIRAPRFVTILILLDRVYGLRVPSLSRPLDAGTRLLPIGPINNPAYNENATTDA